MINSAIHNIFDGMRMKMTVVILLPTMVEGNQY